MELGLIKKVDIDREMQQSYLDYAMSVIVARALPDARDGLKPVQRRILYAMYDMGLRTESSYKKSARIVGEVLGKYHPHGDTAVYEAMARLAQDFSMRYQLVDGQGNFGSVDGDPPAAMRYTEARLPATAMEMLVQLEKNTVNFLPNFDETLTEPEVLPAAIPNLLVNGATGIAVGMATNIPPHNLGEVVDACIFLLERWDKLEDIAVDELMKFIKGPDFPTGGVIIYDPQSEGLAGAYGSGRGRITVQARAHLEDSGRGRTRIIVTELPYMTNKSSLIERIAELAREGAIDGLTDLRDESDRQGMRILIELSKTADPEKILRDLYKRTPMQSTFGINLLALVNGEPRLLNLKQALKVYLEHRLEVIRRRSEYDLDKARQRAHILEGLRIALKNLDEIINIIRNAKDVDDARQKLIKRFKLSDVQTSAILDMPLRRLAALERKKIELEYKEVTALIKDLEDLLKSPQKMRQVISDELNGVKMAYGDRRRTQIVSLKEGESIKALLTTTDVTPAEAVWVAMMEDGTIMRTNDDTTPKFSGREVPNWLIHTNTHHTLYIVGQDGISTAIPVHALPFADKPADGVPVAKISPLEDGFIPAALFSLPPDKDDGEDVYVLSATRGGMVKKTAVADLPGPSSNTFTMVKVNSGDALGWMALTQGKQEILLCTAQGMGIRFSEEDVRSMGMVAAGVNGIKLAVGDEVIGAEVLQGNEEIFIIASDGKAKRVAVKDFPVQGRYGQGVIAWKLTKGTRVAGMTVGKGTSRCIIHLARAASKSMRLDEAVLQGRATQGQSVVDVKTGDAVLSLTAPLDILALWSQSVAPKSTPKPRKKAAQGPKQAELFAEIDEEKGPAAPPKTRTRASKGTGTTKTPATTNKRKSAPAGKTAPEKPSSSPSRKTPPRSKPKTGQ